MSWIPQRGYAGTEEDCKLLERRGWKMVTDSGGFIYWIGARNAGVVTLYADGTWSGGPDAFEKLEDYLEWFASGQPWPPRPVRS